MEQLEYEIERTEKVLIQDDLIPLQRKVLTIYINTLKNKNEKAQ